MKPGWAIAATVVAAALVTAVTSCDDAPPMKPAPAPARPAAPRRPSPTSVDVAKEAGLVAKNHTGKEREKDWIVSGMGGGTIKSGGVAAAVLGTTLIVSATADGGFKVILLEGKGRVTLPNGKSVTLKAGQLVYVLPGGTTFSAVLDINLDKLVAGSLLINGFSHELPSLLLIKKAMAAQNSEIASGKTVDTGVGADNFVNPPAHGNGLDTMDLGTYQVAVPPPLTRKQLSQLASQNPNGGTVFGSPGGRGIVPLGFDPNRGGK